MDPAVIAGAFRFKTDYAHPGMRLIERAVQLRSTWFQLPYGDQAIFLPKVIFERIGGFPEVAIGEDLLLVRRLNRRGKIQIAPSEAITSGRRWKTLGLFRTTLINAIIAIGCLLGADSTRLAPFYRLGIKKE